MKKTVSLFILGMFFVLGSQQAFAQDEYREQAKKQVEKLDQLLDLNQSQEERVYRVYVANEINTSRIEGKVKNKEWKASRIKYATSLMKTMKKTLTPEQFEKYKSYRMENMTDEEREIMMEIKERRENNQ